MGSRLTTVEGGRHPRPESGFSAKGLSRALPPLTPVAELLELQRSAGNHAVAHLLQTVRSPQVQRGRYDKYIKLVGSQYPKGSHEETMARAGFDKAVAEKGSKQAKKAVAPALDAVLAGAKNSFTPKTPNWAHVVDRLFTNYLQYAEQSWDYTAGGMGAAPIFVAGSGHCGALATGFLHSTHLLATEMKAPALKAQLASHPGDSVTPVIATVVNTAVGPQNSLAGKNHSVGNVAAQIDAADDPFDADYAGVNKGAFNNHTWVQVTMPTGETRIYDPLMKSHGVAVTPSFPGGYVAVPARDETGQQQAPPIGFQAGKFLVANSVYNRTNAVQAAVEGLQRNGLKGPADIRQLSDAVSDPKVRVSAPADLVAKCKAAKVLMELPWKDVSLYFRTGRATTRSLFETVAATVKLPVEHVNAVAGD